MVLGFDLGSVECFPCGADVDTRSVVLARAKHNRDSEVRRKKSDFLKFPLLYILKLHFYSKVLLYAFIFMV